MGPLGWFFLRANLTSGLFGKPGECDLRAPPVLDGGPSDGL